MCNDISKYPELRNTTFLQGLVNLITFTISADHPTRSGPLSDALRALRYSVQQEHHRFTPGELDLVRVTLTVSGDYGTKNIRMTVGLMILLALRSHAEDTLNGPCFDFYRMTRSLVTDADDDVRSIAIPAATRLLCHETADVQRRFVEGGGMRAYCSRLFDTDDDIRYHARSTIYSQALQGYSFMVSWIVTNDADMRFVVEGLLVEDFHHYDNGVMCFAILNLILSENAHKLVYHFPNIGSQVRDLKERCRDAFLCNWADDILLLLDRLVPDRRNND